MEILVYTYFLIAVLATFMGALPFAAINLSVVNTAGEAINQEVLSYIGKPTEISGHAEKMEDWTILEVDPQTGIKVQSGASQIYQP